MFCLKNSPARAELGCDWLNDDEPDGREVELKDDEGFLGDRASKGAFRKIFDRWRKPLRKSGEDPFGDEPSDKISKKKLDEMLVGDDTEASPKVAAAVSDARRYFHQARLRGGVRARAS